MGIFGTAPFGYRRDLVDARLAELEREVAELSASLGEREDELRSARGELSEMRARREQNRNKLEAIGDQIEELQAQARGQATRIRMKALKEAADMGERVTDLAKRAGLDPGVLLEFRRQSRELEGSLEAEGEDMESGPAAIARLYDGVVSVEIGPLADFAQLAGFEDALRGIEGCGDVAVKRFSQGRATVVVRLSEPVELLRELEQRSSVGFDVRAAGPERAVLDVAAGEADQAEAA